MNIISKQYIISLTIDPIDIDCSKSWYANSRKYFDMEKLIILYDRESTAFDTTFVGEKHFDVIDKENNSIDKFRYRHIGPFLVNMVSRKKYYRYSNEYTHYEAKDIVI